MRLPREFFILYGVSKSIRYFSKMKVFVPVKTTVNRIKNRKIKHKKGKKILFVFFSLLFLLCVYICSIRNVAELKYEENDYEKVFSVSVDGCVLPDFRCVGRRKG